MSALENVWRLCFQILITWGMLCFLVNMAGGNGKKLFIIPLKKVGKLLSDLALWLVETLFHWLDIGLRAFGRWVIRLFRRSRSTP